MHACVSAAAYVPQHRRRGKDILSSWFLQSALLDAGSSVCLCDFQTLGSGASGDPISASFLTMVVLGLQIPWPFDWREPQLSNYLDRFDPQPCL